MLEVLEAVGKAAGLLDDEVDRLGAAVGDAMGLEPGQDVFAPHLQGPPQPGDLGDRAVMEGADGLLRIALPAAGVSAWYIDLSCW